MQVEYHNSTGLLAVIGDPIAHSLSPLLQNTMIAALGRDDLYLAIPVARDGLADFLFAAKTIGLRGFNLTMPHKETVIPHLASMTPEALRAGSVNSVRILDGRLEGHSTDGLGFRRAMADFGYDFPGQTVTILGAGGAARSIAMTAADAGASSVRVVNRTLKKAEEICKNGKNLSAHSLAEVEALLPDTDLFVNTTPVGMEGTGQAGAFPFLRALKPGAPVFDCIYAPALTPCMETAKALGHKAFNGIGMLVYQAVYAYAFFCGEEFDAPTVSALGARLLAAAAISPEG